MIGRVPSAGVAGNWRETLLDVAHHSDGKTKVGAERR
jgi:hypothetical protein